MLRTLVAALAAVLLAGCVTFNPTSSGMKVSDEAMASIRDNVDTKDTIAAKLGQPTRKTAKDGKDFWQYDYKLMSGSFKITEQEITTFEFSTNTNVLVAHYKGATPAVPATTGTSAAVDGDDLCQKAVYKQQPKPPAKAKLEALYQKCTADCKATYDKYKNKGTLDYTTALYKSCVTAYTPGGAYYNAAQLEK